MINKITLKYLIPVLGLFFTGPVLMSQNYYATIEGKVSYVTTQYVYVKFQSTENISKGDTLYSYQAGVLAPVLVVGDISSISCACIPISTQKLSIADLIVSGRKAIKPVIAGDKDEKPGLPAEVKSRDSVVAKPVQPKKRKQLISGNFTVASYLNFSNITSNSQRMRYSFSLNAKNIGNSKLSAEAYINFVHKIGEWSEVRDDIFNGLKIYSLALNYEFNKHHKIWLGRKINPRISNAGPVDGLQYELKFNSFTFGVIAGTRPDYKNYSFNPNLFQFGGYLGHDLTTKKGNMQTTIAFIEQMNNGFTDRRFAYFQHSNALLTNLYFFGSVEVGLYKKVMNPVDTIQKDTTYTKDNSPTLSNLYLSLRYRPIRQLSLSISYSALNNIIYYETYPKNILEKMIEVATVQGYMFQANGQPVKNLSIGLNIGYRDSKLDPKPSKNLYGYVTYSNVPGINVSATISATLLETSYISGRIYSLGISRDLVPGKLSGGLEYKYVSYKFLSGESKQIQNMADLNLIWRIIKKLSCSLYLEGTFEKNSIFNRVYINITQRF
ncbi:MAG: hypothetical protein WCK84_07220 [Bacteroidota bacterium]